MAELDMPADTVILIDHVSKSFKLPHEKKTSVKSIFVNIFNLKRSFEKQEVLKDISVEIKKGDFFGIVGRNGSGKSTLLKMLAGIYVANKGNIRVKGKLIPFIELGVGFNPELTGRENVYLNGALLGISRKQMDELYDQIVSFAELENFMDQALKNYSSGMQVRLAFSIAIQAKGDILLLDEVLAVGDAAFQKKCLEYFNELKREKHTVVLVTHDMNSVERFCDRAMLIEMGEIKMIGKSADVAREYEEMFIREEIDRKSPKHDGNIYADDPVQVISTSVEQDGKKTKSIKAFKDFTIKFKLKSQIDAKDGFVGMYIKNYEGRVVLSTDTELLNKKIDLRKGKEFEVEFKVENILTSGTYTINISGGRETKGVNTVLIQKRPIDSFIITGVEKYRDSLVHPKVSLTIKDK